MFVTSQIYYFYIICITPKSMRMRKNENTSEFSDLSSITTSLGDAHTTGNQCSDTISSMKYGSCSRTECNSNTFIHRQYSELCLDELVGGVKARALPHTRAHVVNLWKYSELFKCVDSQTEEVTPHSSLCPPPSPPD